MKKYLLLLSFLYLTASTSSVFAYDLSDKDWDLVDRRVEMYENQIEQKGESYRQKILRSLDGRIRIFSQRANTERIVAINQGVRDMLAEGVSNDTTQNVTTPNTQSGTQGPTVVYNTTTNNVTYNSQTTSVTQTQNNTNITQNVTGVQINTPVKLGYSIPTVATKVTNAVTTGLKFGDTNALLGEFQLEIQNNDNGLKFQSITIDGGCSEIVKNLAIYDKTTGTRVSGGITKDGRSCFITMNDVIPPNNTNRIYQLRGDIAWPGQLRILIDRMDYIEIQDSVTGYRAKIEDFSGSKILILTDLTIASPVINNPQPTTPVIINPTPTPSIPANKLVIVAAGVSDVGAGKVKFTITNNGSGSVMIKNFYISSTIAAYKGEVASESERISTYSTGTVTLYKGDTASESERISASNVSATGTGLITVDGQATKLEILAGQTVTVLADFDGTTTGDLNIIHASINDVAYFEKVGGTYSTTAISSIRSSNGTGLPATNSFRRSAGAY